MFTNQVKKNFVQTNAKKNMSIKLIFKDGKMEKRMV